MKKYFIFLSIIVMILSFSMAYSGEYKEQKTTFPHDDIDELIIKIDMDAAELRIRTKDIDNMVEADIEYYSRTVEVFTEYEKEGRTGTLNLESENRKRFHLDTEDNVWDIVLSNKYETEITINLGASDAEIDLGGLPIRYLDFDIGAGKADINFREANPIVADKIIFDAGAGELNVINVGNTNFKKLTFDGGVGSFKLDFSGNYKEKSRAKVSVGLGELIIYIPNDLPVKVDADDGFLSSIDFRNDYDLEEEDGYYESNDFHNSDNGLIIDIDIGLGQAEVIFVD